MNRQENSIAYAMILGIILALSLFLCGCMGNAEEGSDEIYNIQTLMNWSDSSDGERSEVQDLFGSGDLIYCAVTDRQQAITVNNTFENGECTYTTLVQWTERERPAFEPEDPTAGIRRNNAFAFRDDGSFLVLDMGEDGPALVIYDRSCVAAFEIKEDPEGNLLQTYLDKIPLEKMQKGSADSQDLYWAGDDTVLLFTSSEETGLAINLKDHSISESNMSEDEVRNGFLNDGLLYVIRDRKLIVVNVPTGEVSSDFKPISLNKVSFDNKESFEPVLAGIQGEYIYWIGVDGFHKTSETERKDQRILGDFGEWSVENGWTPTRARLDSNLNWYVLYQRSDGQTKEQALVFYGKEQMPEKTIGEMHLVGKKGIYFNCNENGIYFTRSIKSSYQPEEFWNDAHSYLQDYYEMWYTASFEDSYIRPRCSIEGCTHTAPECEAWILHSKGVPITLTVNDALIDIYSINSDVRRNTWEEFVPSDSCGIIICENGESEPIAVLSDMMLAEGSEIEFYSDGKTLIVPVVRTDAFRSGVILINLETGAVEREIWAEMIYSRTVMPTENAVFFRAAMSGKSLRLDLADGNIRLISNPLTEVDLSLYGFTFDGCCYKAELIISEDQRNQIQYPEGFDHYQISMENEDKALVKFTNSSSYRNQVSIVDLNTGEVLYRPVPMNNEWGEELPMVWGETEQYYIFTPYALRNSISYPPPPDYFDGFLQGRTYRYVYAFIGIEEFWNGSQDYTVFWMN